MKSYTGIITAAALVISVLISSLTGFVRDGRELDRLRGEVLRLHIIANSDSPEDQRLKLRVRDAVLEHSGDFFGDAGSRDEAELGVREKLPEICALAERTLRENGCGDRVSAEITDVEFNERTYGDITMPAGEYRALRITIGKAAGHNWWCVLFPPLCIPAACGVVDDEEKEKECFDEEELEILHKPKKYRVRFAIWDKMKSWLD